MAKNYGGKPKIGKLAARRLIFGALARSNSADFLTAYVRNFFNAIFSRPIENPSAL
jgi:hypothetical protein